LHDAGAALCVAESDELVTPPVRTAEFGYLRLRRLDYDAPALAKWAVFARTHPGEVFTYFKHEDEARGPAFARDFLPLVSSQSSRPESEIDRFDCGREAAFSYPSPAAVTLCRAAERFRHLSRHTLHGR